MKRAGALLTVLCLAVLAACSSPLRGGGEGTITIAFGAPARLAIHPGEITYLTHTITISGPGDTIAKTITGSGSMTVNVETGIWSISVSAHGPMPDAYEEAIFPLEQDEKMLRAIGFEQAEVRAWRNTSVAIQMISATEVNNHQQLASAIELARRDGEDRLDRDRGEKVIILMNDIQAEAAYTVDSDQNITIISGTNGDAAIIRAPGFDGKLFSVEGRFTLGRSGMAGVITLDGGETELSADAPLVEVYPGATLAMRQDVIMKGSLPGEEPFTQRFNAGTTRQGLFRWPLERVPGNSLEDQLSWLRDNAQANSVYYVELANFIETISPAEAGLPDGIAVHIIIRGNGNEISLSRNGSLFTVYEGITLTLGNVTLRGVDGNDAPLLAVKSGGTLIMNARTTITCNVNDATHYEHLSGGAVRVAGTFTMNDGTISDNRSSTGGGVFVAEGGTFTMNGGAIFGNDAELGGAVFVHSSGSFTMSGGAVFGNSAGEGASVYVSTGGTARYVGAFLVYGSDIYTTSEPLPPPITVRRGNGTPMPFGSLAGALDSVTQDNVPHTITLFDNATLDLWGGMETPGASRNITLTGAGTMRTITHTGDIFATMFTITGGSLTLGNNITLHGRADGIAGAVPSIIVGANGRLTMLDGSVITGHITEGGGVSPIHISGTNALLDMRGGQITGNYDNYVSRIFRNAVVVDNGAVTMSGGSITGNNSHTESSDLLLSLCEDYSSYASLTLSGTSEIGVLRLAAQQTIPTVYIGDWKGTVGQLDLEGDAQTASINEVIETWIASGVRVLTAAAGHTLNADCVERFLELRYFVPGANPANRERISGFAIGSSGADLGRLALDFLGAGTAADPIQVPGDALASQLNWLRLVAPMGIGNYYRVEISGNETIGPQAELPGVTIILRGSGAMRTVRLAAAGNLFMVGDGVTLVLENNVTLMGPVAANNTSLMHVSGEGTLIMNAGTRITGNAGLQGGVRVHGTLRMNGGSIDGHTITTGNGAGVHVAEGGVFEMRGGEIFGNVAQALTAQGGGVFVADGGSFQISRGVIYGNEDTVPADRRNISGTVTPSHAVHPGNGTFRGTFNNGTFTQIEAITGNQSTTVRVP